jgi:hypothetical protein
VKRERQRQELFGFLLKVFCLVCGCKSSTKNCTGAIKFKNQNYVPNTIFFLNCDFSCETKIMYQTEFFLQS